LNSLDFADFDLAGSSDFVLTLLPGLITYLVVKLLTARDEKIETADAIVKGLAYTVVAHAFWALLSKLEQFHDFPTLSGLVIISLTVGVLSSCVLLSGMLYKVLRLLGFSDQSDYSSTWESYLKKLGRDGFEYSQIHLKDGRIIFGAIIEYSGKQSDGHLIVSECDWLDEDGKQTPVEGLFLVPCSEIVLLQGIHSSNVKTTTEELSNDQLQ
jgi:hypothetical protein